MPAPFSEEERGRIRNRLLASGESLFARYGLDKTSIDELAKSAGISKGAFYLFFDSKEDLFLAIAEGIERIERKKIQEKIAKTPPGLILRTFIEALFGVFETHPFLKTINKPDVITRIHTKVRPERFQEHLGLDDRFFLEFLRAIAPPKKGDESSLGPWITAIKSIFLLYLHSDEVGRDWKPGARLLTDLLSAGWKEYCR